MDEVNNETRIALLEALNDVINHSGSVIKIFVTTRMDRDILYRFRIFPLIELHPDDNATDIDNFIGIKVHSFLKEKNWLNNDVEGKLRRDICRILGTRCKGNFQLASLQIQLLRQLDIKEDIHGELRKLPDTLAKTYDEIYRNINSKPGRSARLAFNTFRWIQCSGRPLESEELLNVVNTEVSSTGEFHTISAKVEAETLLAVCQNLVILDKQLNVFRLAHLSVDEYLKTKLPEEESHLEIASVCLSLLCNDDTAWDTLPQNIDDWVVNEAFERKDYLFFYSHVYWPWHFSRCGLITRDDHIISRVWDKFSAADVGLRNTRDTYMRRWARLYDLSRQRVWIPYEYERDSFYQRSDIFQSCRRTCGINEYPLVCVCTFRLYQGLQAVLGSGVETGESTLDMLLSTSIRDRDLEIARVLLDKGANASATTESGDTPLHRELFQGHKDMAKLFIEKGANVSATNISGDTPLHVASSAGHKIVAQLLIDNGANVSATSKSRDTPLHIALRWGHTDVTQLLIGKGANVSATGRSDDTPLHIALRRGHTDVAQLLIDKGAYVCATNGSGDTPLHVASSRGHTDVVKVLLDNGANIDATNEHGETALHIAVKSSHTSTVEVLNRGAIIDIPNLYGDTTPLVSIAASEGKGGIVKLLVNNGSSVDSTHKDGETMLHKAARSANLEVIDFLLKSGAAPNPATKDGETPLHAAARSGRADIVELLLKNGAPIEFTTKNGKTALHIAARYSHTNAVHVLLEMGASIHTTDDTGSTALHAASVNDSWDYSNSEVVDTLLNNSARIDAIDRDGETALHIACRWSYTNVVAVLLQRGAMVDARNKDGQTALHLASRYSHSLVIDMLLEAGANIDSRDNAGGTVLHTAVLSAIWSWPVFPVLNFLVERGVPIDAVDANGTTALHIAATWGAIQVIKLLLENGARVGFTTQDGWTALHFAAWYGRAKVAKLLLEHGSDFEGKTKDGDTALDIAYKLKHYSVLHLMTARFADE